MKQTLMIHEWDNEFYNMGDILEKYILTFDDGLYSQYEALEFLKTLKTVKIFFVSTDIIRPVEVAPSRQFIKCADAHKKAFDGNLENYMNWEEIMEIHNTQNCIIGGHGHRHIKTWKIESLRNKHPIIEEDAAMMIFNFNNEGIEINRFCYPYNYEDPIYSAILKKYHGIEKFYNGDRIAIEDLIEELKKEEK